MQVLKKLSDDEVVKLLERMIRDERTCLAEVLNVLAEFDERRLYAGKSYSSTFTFCMDRFSFSEDEAYRRIFAARLARKYPSIFGMVQRCEISLTALTILGQHLNSDNHQSVLRSARGKSKIELEMMAAKLKDKAKPPEPVPVGAPAEPSLPMPALMLPAASVAAPVPPPKARVLTPEIVRIEFNATPQVFEKIRTLTGLLRHKYPNGRYDDVLAQAVEDSLRRRLGGGDRKTKSNPRSRRVPKWVRKAVWARDGGRCVFVSEDGRTCGSKSFIQYDHILPFADGGPSNDPANIRLLCGTHNRARNTS